MRMLEELRWNGNVKKIICIILTALCLFCSCKKEEKTLSYADNVKETVNADTFFITYDGVGLTCEQYKNFMNAFTPPEIFSMPYGTTNELKDDKSLFVADSEFEVDGEIYNMNENYYAEWNVTANNVTLSRDEYYKLTDVLNPDMIDVLDAERLDILLKETKLTSTVSDFNKGDYIEKLTTVSLSDNKTLRIVEYRFSSVPKNKGVLDVVLATEGKVVSACGYQRYDNQYERYFLGDASIEMNGSDVVLKTDINDKVKTTLHCTLIVLEEKN